jgi:hypothetical protein
MVSTRSGRSYDATHVSARNRKLTSAASSRHTSSLRHVSMEDQAQAQAQSQDQAAQDQAAQDQTAQDQDDPMIIFTDYIEVIEINLD